MNETILLEKTDDGIATITFNRPDSMNALNMDAMARFATCVESLADDDSVRVVILTGAGTEAFCSGGDLFELSTLKTESEAEGFIDQMGDALSKLEHLPVPVIAAINGYALGGGSEIAVACDMRFADERVRMGFVQIRMALTPGWGAGQRLMRMIGYAKAMHVLLEGHVFHAPELEKLGLINKIVDAGSAYDHALGFAREIAERPPDVVRGIKALLRAGLEQPYLEALRTERDIFPPLWTSKPHLEAVEKFLQRQRDKKETS